MANRPTVQSRLLDLLGGKPEGLTLEALHAALMAATGRPYPLDEVASHLRARPQHFTCQDQRWRLAADVRREALREQQARRARSPRADAGLAPDGTVFVVFDLESTGVDPAADAPIELAAIRFEAGREVARYQSLVNPGRPLSPGAARVTGLTDAALADAPALGEALPAFLAFLGDAPLVGHNISRFDLPMLTRHAAALGLDWVPGPAIDTLELALLVVPRLGRHTLAALGAHYAQLNAEEGLHRAMADVALNARVFAALRAETAIDPHLHAVLTTLLPPSDWPAAAFLGAPSTPSSLSAAFGAMRPVLLPPRDADVEAAVDLASVVAKLTTTGDPRPSQAAMAVAVGRTLITGDRLMIEAPTGTGKTRAYLLPALAHARAAGRRVIIAPNSRLLQDQVFSELDALGEQPRVCRFMGNQNLVCRLHLERFTYYTARDPGAVPLARRLALAQVLSSLRGRTEGFLRDLPTRWLDGGDPDGEGRVLRDELALGPGCMRHSEAAAAEAEDDTRCWGRAMRLNAARCDLLVTNQVMLFKSLEGLAPLGDLVFDEAHNLEDAATLAWTRELTDAHLVALAGRMRSADGKRGLAPDLATTDPGLAARMDDWQIELRRFAEEIAEQLRVYFARKLPPRARDGEGPAPELSSLALGVPDLGTTEWKAVDACLAPLARLLAAIGDALATHPAPGDVALAAALTGLAEELTGMTGFLSDFLALGTRLTQVYSLEHGPARWGFKREPLDVTPLLASAVYEPARAVVWTSATLTIEDAFDFVAGRIGAAALSPPPAYVQLEPAFDYARNALVVLTNHLPTPRGVALVREFPHHVAQELARFIRFFGGGLLGLFTSRQRMRLVADLVGRDVARDGFPVQAQAGDLQAQVEAFRADPTASLFGVKSLWEGVSVEGASLSFVAMSKLPFPIPSPLKHARAEHLRKTRAVSAFLEYDVPLAAMQFKQGFGRLNRTPADRGAVLVLDRRLQHAMLYKDAFLRSLPGPPSIHYARGEDFYARICQFLGRPFDAARLGAVQGTFEERLLADLGLPGPILDDAGYAAYRPRLLALLEQLFGHAGFRPHQEAIVRAQLTGRDVLAILPTGSGKSLTFQLPALLRPGLTLVVSPLVALMKDQVDGLREKVGAATANCLIGGQSSAEVSEILDDVASGRMKLLYLAPERLVEPRVVDAIGRASLMQVVVDEAHCVATWGHAFRPEFLDIRERLAHLPRVPIAALTATAPPAMRGEIGERLGMVDAVEIVAGADRPNLRLDVLPCHGDEERRRTLIALVRGMALRRGWAGIVYVGTRRAAEEVRELLRMQNVVAEAYHAGMAPLEKHAIQEQFMNGDVEVIVATNAFGMGVDKADVRFVVHFDPPESPEMYYQEAGRAGRDGEPAHAILLQSEAAIKLRRFLIRKSLPTPEALGDFARALDELPKLGELRFFAPGALAIERDPGDPGRTWLHYLERAGRVCKVGGFSATIRLKLHQRRAAVEAALGDDAALLRALFDHAGLTDFRQADIDLVAFAVPRGLDPRDVEAALLRRTERGRLSYRALTTGQVLGPAAGPARPLDAELARMAELGEGRLARMVAYTAETGCRWRYLRAQLGDDEAPPTCGRCDRCAPEQALPWDLADVAFLPPMADLLDLTGTLVEAVRAHDEALGRGSIAAMLAGDQFNGQSRLAASARSSPFFGQLRGLGRKEILDAIDAHVEQGLMAIKQVARGANAYPMLALTAAGARLLGGAAPAGDEEAELDAD